MPWSSKTLWWRSSGFAASWRGSPDAAGQRELQRQVSHAAHADSPTDAMLRDPPFVINLVLWAACITALIYQGMLG